MYLSSRLIGRRQTHTDGDRERYGWVGGWRKFLTLPQLWLNSWNGGWFCNSWASVSFSQKEGGVHDLREQDKDKTVSSHWFGGEKFLASRGHAEEKNMLHHRPCVMQSKQAAHSLIHYQASGSHQGDTNEFSICLFFWKLNIDHVLLKCLVAISLCPIFVMTRCWTKTVKWTQGEGGEMTHCPCKYSPTLYLTLQTVCIISSSTCGGKIAVDKQ